VDNITFNCEKCSKAITVDEELAGREIPCPHCQQTIRVPRRKIGFKNNPQGSTGGGNPCPHCNSQMAYDTVICMNCGWDLRTNKQVKTRSSLKGIFRVIPRAIGLILVLGVLAWAWSRWHQDILKATGFEIVRTTTNSIPFDIHDGYFASNKFEPKAKTSFVVLRDQKAFDEVFGVAMVMNDKSHRLPPDSFTEKMVVAAVHRGKAVWGYRVESIVTEGKTLIVKYTSWSKPSETAEYACPLIISVPQGDYATVQFVENRKAVKKLELAEPAT